MVEDRADTTFAGATPQPVEAAAAEAAPGTLGAPAAAGDAGEQTLTPEELAQVHARNAFIRAADAALTDVRQRSYEGKLTGWSRWAKRAFAPQGMDAKTFRAKLVAYIEERDHAEAKPVMGRISAPEPLSVQLEGKELSEDEPLPDLDVRDLAFMQGKKDIYLYSVALLSHSFARALFHTQEDSDVATFVDVVRTESSVYPRPVGIDSFMNPPYLWAPDKTARVYKEVVESGSFKDIHETRTSTNVPYYYSDLYLSEAQAKALAQWYGVERQMNP